MTPLTREKLRRLFSDDAVNEALDELKAELTRKAVSKKSGQDERQQHLNMLWGLESLVVKVQANIEPETGDQANE